MNLREVSSALGVEVVGIDAAEPLGTDDVRELRSALDAHGLLLLRGQHLDEAHHEAFVRHFGGLNDLTVDDTGRATTMYVSNSQARADATLGSDRILFHSDITCSPWPQPGTSLFAVELPAGGTSTWFANSARALATLPDDLRARIDGRRAHHAGFIFNQDYTEPARVRPPGPYAPRSAHPMVLTHPRTGVELLWVSDLFTERVEGMDPSASRDLLDALCAHIDSPPHTYEHHWKVGDLVVWDNYTLQHARGAQVGSPRTLRRLGWGDMQDFVLPTNAQPMREWMAAHVVLTAARQMLDDVPAGSQSESEPIAALANAFAYYDRVRVRDDHAA
jgi:taurine dioxygenase